MKWDIGTDGDSIILNGEVLADDGPAHRLLGRKGQVRQLERCLRPVSQRRRPLNVWLHGPAGSGKTTLARWVVEAVVPTASSVVSVHVNCWQHRSLYSVTQAIVDELRILAAEAQDTNFKLDRITQALGGRPMVVILDEIDRPMPAQRDAIIYGLLSLPRSGLICTARSLQPLAAMDGGVRSRLSPIAIEMPAYSRRQIAEIATDRASCALTPGCWSPPLIGRIADAAGGDARVAIAMLRHTAVAAEEAGRAKLDIRAVEPFLRQWRKIKLDEKLAGLSDHERVIHELATRYQPIGTVELMRRYEAYCIRHTLQPVARRTFRKYVSRLHSAGLLDIKSSSSGPRGRMVRCLHQVSGARSP